jgi:biopolymer transport protein ExbB
MKTFLSRVCVLALALPTLSPGQTDAQFTNPPVEQIAQNQPAAIPPMPEPTPQGISFLEIVDKTGPLIYPLAALSFLAVVLVILYTLTIRQGTVVSDKFMNAADALIRKGDYKGLLAVCERQGECIARVTQKTLTFAMKNPTAGFDEVREVTEAEGSRQASLLNQRITYLADIGAIAPMVGLLGTVIGMITSFNEIAQDNFLGAKQLELAGGVSQALLTTAGGLMVGIPALIFYSIFRGRVQRLISELEAAATHLMALLGAQYKKVTQQQRAQPQSNQPT